MEKCQALPQQTLVNERHIARKSQTFGQVKVVSRGGSAASQRDCYAGRVVQQVPDIFGFA